MWKFLIYLQIIINICCILYETSSTAQTMDSVEYVMENDSDDEYITVENDYDFDSKIISISYLNHI